MWKMVVAVGIACGTGLPMSAQQLDVPVVEHEGDGQAASCGLSEVRGLKAGGDGFLGVRSGPGTTYRKIGELHNGDRVNQFSAQGDWVGIATSDGIIDQPGVCANDGPARKLTGTGLGWVHSDWLLWIAP